MKSRRLPDELCRIRIRDATGRKGADFDKGLPQITFIPEKKRRRGVPVTLPLVGVLKEHLAGLPREGE